MLVPQNSSPRYLHAQVAVQHISIWPGVLNFPRESCDSFPAIHLLARATVHCLSTCRLAFVQRHLFPSDNNFFAPSFFLASSQCVSGQSSSLEVTFHSLRSAIVSVPSFPISQLWPSCYAALALALYFRLSKTSFTFWATSVFLLDHTLNSSSLHCCEVD